jgi:hypothetical protein
MNKEHIHLKLGTVKEAEADAIISEINNDLIFAPEAHCSLGPDVDTEIIRQCLAIGKLELGEAVVTDAGDLDARWVIHAASNPAILPKCPVLVSCGQSHERHPGRGDDFSEGPGRLSAADSFLGGHGRHGAPGRLSACRDST